MNLLSNANSTPKPMLWTGWGLSGLIVLFFLSGGVMTLIKPPDEAVRKIFRLRPEPLFPGSGITTSDCLRNRWSMRLPQTSVLGAILLTGYLGGAVATHVRIHDVFFAPIIAGVVVRLGLFLARCPHSRLLVPLRK